MIGMLVVLASLGQSTAVPHTVDDIVARHIQARGGYERLKAVQTIKITRTVATPFSDLKVVVYKKRPQLYRSEQGPAGQPPVPRAVHAEGAWDLVQGKVVSRNPQAFAETRDLDADFDGLLVDWKHKGHVVTLEGNEPLPGGEAYKLKVVTKSGVTRHVYLDAKTFLDRRHTGAFTIHHPSDPARNRQFSIVMDFGGWREVDGVTFPFDITEERTGKEPVQTFVTYTEKIELNVPMEDSLFAPPAR